ncbi:hypothetical protein MES4922_380009 [Mesorhizobium ventifaucium]|uniref:Uncharacterized protein n=1 Tax=Mesorhizobium ventifaucium TaxID=666020 RepID=A0ABM9E6U5_9HYPH|nr:hypothetical protein MES4922_380009 [Mesorhizobium ventifaucium]
MGRVADEFCRSGSRRQPIFGVSARRVVPGNGSVPTDLHGLRSRARLADLGRLVKVHFGRRGPRLTGTAEEKMPLFPRRHATCHLAIALINALLHEGLATSAPNSIDILA